MLFGRSLKTKCATGFIPVNINKDSYPKKLSAILNPPPMIKFC